MEINQIKDLIIAFRNARNWQQFHLLKDLILGLNIETAELSELFLWKSEEQISEVDKSKIENELADIFIFLVYLSEHFNIDLQKSILDKIQINEVRYPVDKSYGSNKKYNEL